MSFAIIGQNSVSVSFVENSNESQIICLYFSQGRLVL